MLKMSTYDNMTKCSCGKYAVYGIVDKNPTHCATCKTDDMRDVKNRRCSCGHRPHFGLIEKKPTHCKKCKTDDMRNVTHRKCSCGTRASFGLENGKPTHCAKCKTDDMKDVVSKMCSCGNRPSFGVKDGKPTHCVKCKTDDMKDVVSKKCLCGKCASFGLINGNPTHCKDCKTDDMKDVKHKMCQCGNRPSFGFVDGNPTHCEKCKSDDMRNIVSKMCPCGKIPCFGFQEEKPTCCVECKVSGMENVVDKRCSGYNGEPCNTGYLLAPGRDYCLACDPDDSRRLDRKRSEAAFFNFLKKSGIEITQREFPVHYMCIDTNRKMAFVDGIIITKSIVVCLELDEDAHERYPKSCEEARMHNVTAELMLAYPDHHIVWVRVNPHIKKNGKRDSSRKAIKIRNQRHQEAVGIIRDILQNPRDCVEYVGY